MRTLKECEEYLLNIPKFKKKTLLSDTQKFYELLGSPAKGVPKIHVAGTNGKGSTCFYTAKILKKHGLKVGLFTSPHLVTMRERFVFDDEMITESEFIAVFEKILAKCEMYDEEEKARMHPSFFEFLFLMFMEWMQMKDADACVLETGLGGLLDATNIFEKPAVCVICSIGIDHIEQLGGTIEEIAEQKAGIIKENVPVVYLDNGEAVNGIIEETAKKRHSDCFRLSESCISGLSLGKKQIAFSLNYDYDNVEYVHDLSICLNTSAAYQRINSSLAIITSKIFLGKDFDENKTRLALKEESFKGRFEEIAPDIFVDGAHNEDALGRLFETLRTKEEKKTLIFGACRDKEYKKMVSMISESKLFDTVIFTRINSSRAVDADTLIDTVSEKNGIVFKTSDSFKEAIVLAKETGNTVYIAGSLYLVGEAEEYFGN
ncbi:MAG: hypothetical protein K5776_09795 [Lachnospiraceae bacterium]|nr:hypothetical protein [Lachnospiraceae bacterium]